jgi:hypothetical protein
MFKAEGEATALRVTKAAGVKAVAEAIKKAATVVVNFMVKTDGLGICGVLNENCVANQSAGHPRSVISFLMVEKSGRSTLIT